MSSKPIPAPNNVVTLLNQLKAQDHHPRLEEAHIVICFEDVKPFKKGRFNWGKVTKFSPFAKLWHPKNEKYDFQIALSADGWYQLLDEYQQKAWLELQLTRCQVEMIPKKAKVNGKVQVIKDEFGRIEYTDEVKVDEE